MESKEDASPEPQNGVSNKMQQTPEENESGQDDAQRVNASPHQQHDMIAPLLEQEQPEEDEQEDDVEVAYPSHEQEEQSPEDLAFAWRPRPCRWNRKVVMAVVVCLVALCAVFALGKRYIDNRDMATVVYTVEEDPKYPHAKYRRTIQFPRGYQVVSYRVGPALRDCAACPDPNYQFELLSDDFSGYSYSIHGKHEYTVRSSNPWIAPGRANVPYGVPFRIPLEMHVQVGNVYQLPTNNSAIAERSGSYVAVTNWYDQVWANLADMVKGWEASESGTTMYGTYNETTQLFDQPTTTIPNFYGVATLAGETSPGEASGKASNITIPVGYGLLLYTVTPDQAQLERNFSCQTEMLYHVTKHRSVTIPLNSTYHTELTDKKEILLPPEHHVKLVNTANRNGYNPAVRDRCGLYAIITKNPENVNDKLDSFVSQWSVPNGSFEFIEHGEKITVPDGYGYVYYGVVPTAKDDTSANFTAGWMDMDFHSQSWFFSVRSYYPEFGDTRYHELHAEEHVKVSNVSLAFRGRPKDERLAQRCGTYVVMTNNPKAVYSTINATIRNWTIPDVSGRFQDAAE